MTEALVAFLLFTIALLVAGYYVWSVPEQQAYPCHSCCSSRGLIRC